MSSRKLKTTAYQTLVRPLVEYAPSGPSLWGPNQDIFKKAIIQVEKVQRKATRWVTSRYRNRSSPTEMLAELRWSSLEDQRHNQCISMMFKMTSGFVAMDTEQYIPCEDCSPHHTHSHSYMIRSTSTDYYRCSFFPHNVREWNLLPSSIVEAPTYSLFCTRLSKHFSTH